MVKVNSYQKKKLKEFKDEYFQSLVSLPKVEILKVNQKLVARIWSVDELFYSNYPFVFLDLFKQKLAKHEFAVVYEIVVRFRSSNTEKKVDIKKFLESYGSLSNNDRKKIKEYFIQYIQELIDHNIIEDKIDTIQDGIKYEISSLTTKNISEVIVIYEKLNID